jgi:dGTPase
VAGALADALGANEQAALSQQQQHAGGGAAAAAAAAKTAAALASLRAAAGSAAHECAAWTEHFRAALRQLAVLLRGGPHALAAATEAAPAVAAALAGGPGAETLRVLSRLEAKIVDESGRSVGLNLSRASLDASCKYPWTRRPGERKFGAYEDDLEIFTWFRDGAPEGRTCLEEQVMNWADDVAYSVHDLEDAVHSQLVSLAAFRSPPEQRALVTTAAQRFGFEEGALEEGLQRLIGLEFWPREFDGSMGSLVELKRFTSCLIGRFSNSAQIATQVAYGSGPFTRYEADLLVPEEVAAEVAVMKAVAVIYVMHRHGADEEYARQRRVIAELVHALVLDEGRSLEAWLRPTYLAAQSDAERLRVVIDQVASLTDVSIMTWHRALVH